MLEKFREFSIALWKPIGDLFYNLYESSNVWVPIILFFVISLLSFYLLHQLINLILNVKVQIDFKNIFSPIIKILIIILITAIIFSLGFYLFSLYEKHEQEIIKKEQDFSYLLQ